MTTIRPFLGNSPTSIRRRTGFTLIETVIMIVILVLLLTLLLPAPSRNRVAARRTQCRNNLKQIGLALHNYLTDYGVFPPAYTTDENGKRLHSWRTLILPYLDENTVYRKVDLCKPWDDPANSEARERMLAVYRCPSADIPGQQTLYLAVVTPQSVLRLERSLSPDEITDGTNKTMLVMEVPVAEAVPWMSPTDADEATVLSVNSKSKTVHDKGVTVLLADGSVRFLPNNVSTDLRRALITATADDTVGDF